MPMQKDPAPTINNIDSHQKQNEPRRARFYTLWISNYQLMPSFFRSANATLAGTGT